ncbi:hypothetical protein [Streptomyces koelreuteriae]|uniref:hypothetical protein n=1 Tax=Streptomyces koelreuteriae TaxID=2838015 RepID=UPI003EB93F4B
MTCAYVGGAVGWWLKLKGCVPVATSAAAALTRHPGATRRTAGRFRRSAAPGAGAVGTTMAARAAVTSREETP